MLPGASDQAVHVDTGVELDHGGRGGSEGGGEGGGPGLVLSIFVALADVAYDQGPLQVWPGSHRFRLNGLATNRHVVAGHAHELGVRVAVPRGSVAMYTSRLSHRGMANATDRPRPNFMFSLLEELREEEGDHVEAILNKELELAETLLPEYGSAKDGFHISVPQLLEMCDDGP